MGRRPRVPLQALKVRPGASHIVWLTLALLIAACGRIASESPIAVTLAPSATFLPSTHTPSPLPPTETPTPRATPTSDCLNEPGRLEAHVYTGVAIAEDIPFDIYLPPCFDQAREGLPVLYLLHGKPFDESHWTSLGLLAVVESNVRDRTWPPFLIVQPRVPEPLFSNSDGGPGSYETEFMEGLLPAIESTYPVQIEGAFRALAGISRGGIWALEIGLRNPGAISRVGALSPSLAVNYPRPAYDPFVLVDQAEEFPLIIFLAAGEADWALLETRRLASNLEMRGAPVSLAVVPGGHEDATWSATLETAIGELVAGW